MNDRQTTDWRPLALLLVAVTALFAVIYRFLPFDAKALAPWPFAAWALYAGARLGLLGSLATTLTVFAATDACLYLLNQYPPNATFYLCLVVYVVLGYQFWLGDDLDFAFLLKCL